MIIRVCICIPTFNNPETIHDVIEDCLNNTDLHILVVDDGSDTPVVLKTASDRVRLIRFDKNRGKGAALQAAFKDCASRGFTHLLSLDGDGQHLASEVAKLTRLAASFPWDLIIGCRRLDAATVPGVSKFGRSFSNFWVKQHTGTKIHDSQSGFRLYPLFHVQNMSFWTRKYDFEIEVLIRLLWRGVAIREVDIDVYYPPSEKRVSHFNKFWDNARISLLNTVFVVMSMLRQHRSPRSIAAALGIGVWIGCTPFFGFHALMALAIAAVFPLNALFLLIGTQISFPIFVPLLVMASLAIGGQISTTDDYAIRYLTGSIALGAVLAVFTASLALLVASYLRNQNGKQTWSGRSRGGRVGNFLVKQIVHYLGLRAAYACMIFVVPYFYLFAPKARRSINEYWKIREPSIGFLSRQWHVLVHFYAFAQILIDRVYQGYKKEHFFQAHAQGFENILQAARSKEGVILLSAHVGGWDLACALLESNGMSSELHLFQYEAKDLTFEKVKQGQPDSLKSHFFDERDAHHEPTLIFTIRDLLEKGLPVGLMGDRPLSHHFELVPFFGKLAPFDVTPFRIAAACQRPVLFSFGFKAKGRVYDFYAEPPKLYTYSSTAPKSHQCCEWLLEYTESLEKMLSRYPYAWFNFYPFWSSLPASPVNENISTIPTYSGEEVRRPANC